MDLVRRVQRAYPQVYLACHLEHTTSARRHGMSERDARVLAHLDELAPVTVSDLARHLGVGLSTVSEAIGRLAALGLITRGRSSSDRRAAALRLTRTGLEHMRASSVLDAARVAAVLARLRPHERATAVRGLELLARASRESTARGPREPTARTPREPTARAPREPTARAPRESTARAPRESTARASRESTARAPRESTGRASRESTARAPRESTGRASRESTAAGPHRRRA